MVWSPGPESWPGLTVSRVFSVGALTGQARIKGQGSMSRRRTKEGAYDQHAPPLLPQGAPLQLPGWRRGASGADGKGTWWNPVSLRHGHLSNAYNNSMKQVLGLFPLYRRETKAQEG